MLEQRLQEHILKDINMFDNVASIFLNLLIFRIYQYLSDLVICSMYCTHDKPKNFQMHDPVDSLHRTIAHPAHFELLMKLLFQGHTSYDQHLANQEVAISHHCQQVKNEKLCQPSHTNLHPQDQVFQECHCY